MTAQQAPALVVCLAAFAITTACSTDEAEFEGPELEYRETCGPASLAPNTDFDTNPRHKGELQCDVEAGETLVGILNQDYGWDSLDGIGALCRRPDGSTREVSFDGDMSNATPDPEPVWCPEGETVTGLAYVDALPVAGVPAGTTDAATVVCSGDSEPMQVADLEGNTNPLQIVECAAGEEPIGFAYVDHDGPSYSDLTDAITLICAPTCTTCEPSIAPVPNPDLDSNTRRATELLCEEHETMVGVMYREYGWDSMDGAGVVCRSGLGTTRTVFHDSDMSNAPGEEVQIECPVGRRVTGLAYKDAERWPGVPGDTTDGVTISCDGSDPMPAADLNDNGNDFRVLTCPAGTEAAGLQYVDLDWHSYSDLADALTIVCRKPCSP